MLFQPIPHTERILILYKNAGRTKKMGRSERQLFKDIPKPKKVNCKKNGKRY